MQSHKEAFSKQEHQSRESLSELLGDLASQSAGLVRDEVALAKQEISEKVASYRSPLAIVGFGAVVATLAAFVLCAALVAGLSEYLKVWIAALIVGGVLAVIACISVSAGLGQLKRLNLTPKKTMKSLEENKEWLKEIT
jgi:predicted phage tail protein